MNGLGHVGFGSEQEVLEDSPWAGYPTAVVGAESGVQRGPCISVLDLRSVAREYLGSFPGHAASSPSHSDGLFDLR